jgi:HD-like signal output (HDOD) protein/ActR/RegA family two-component response regulator
MSCWAFADKDDWSQKQGDEGAMRRVLFVDDEPRGLEGLRRMLRPQRHEWEMAFAPGGEAALALMEASPFDVIVSDMRMPGMDGAALLCRVREQYPQVVRIVLSGHTELSTALRVVPVAHQFLAKPYDTEMLRVAIERACHLKVLLSDESIRRTVGALGDLPSLPRIYEALTLALADPDVSLQKVARIVEQDVGISAKILQLVNSAFFGIAHSMTNIQSAVSFLGINTLKSLILSVEVFHVFEAKVHLPGFSLEQLQRHALLAAHIAARLPVLKHLTDTALVAGMLHDVGKLILAWKLPERFEKLLADAAEEHCPLYKVEEREYGFSHAEVGAYLLGLWGLPYTVAEAVALHHGPNRVPHQSFDAVSAVFVANRLAHELEQSPCEVPRRETIEADQEDLAALGTQEDLSAWRAIAAEVPALIAEASSG